MSIVALIGRPNVGKSSVFNRLVGKRLAIEAKEAGTTRDRVFGVAHFGKREFTVIDVAGVDAAKTEFNFSVKEQIELAQQQADVIVLIVDSQTGVLAEDQLVIDQVRKLGKPVIMVANKADSLSAEKEVEQWKSVGFGHIFPVSAIHNSGIEDLAKKIIELLPVEKKIKPNPSAAKIAIIGRPNVGKSTLLNQLAGENRSVVSNQAGTTRDNVDITLPYKEMFFQFIDTAGIRKRGKIEVGIEKFAVARAIKATEQCDVAFLLIDALDGPTANDAHIAGMCLEFGKGLVIAVNKWDEYLVKFAAEKNLTQNEADDLAQRQMLAKLQTDFAFASFAVVIFISAKDGLNVHKLLEQAHKVVLTRKTVVGQELLDQIVEVATSNSVNLPHIYKLEQVSVNPPSFTVTVNRPQTWHFSQVRFLENVIRQNVALLGTPIKIDIVAYAKSQR